MRITISLSADVDYINIPPSEPIPLVFGPSNDERSVNISIINDFLFELPVEIFFGELTTTLSTVILNPQQANISILDDDGKS